GTGTFSPNNTTLNATYNPSAGDIAAGTVTLTLTSTNNAGCAPVTSQITITITPAPTINAGPDQTVCANNAVVTLNGTFITSTGSGTWSTSGTGIFNPNNTTFNAMYIPSAADVASGSVTLTLTSNNNGNCSVVTSTIILIYTAPPSDNAGGDQTVCANNANVI